MIFRRLFDSDTSTCTYLLADEGSGQAGPIDPVREQAGRDPKLIAELEREKRIAEAVPANRSCGAAAS